MMDATFKADSCFTTTPKLIRRGMGLDSLAFQGMLS